MTMVVAMTMITGCGASSSSKKGEYEGELIMAT